RREDRLLGNKGRILEAELVASLSGKADGGADHLANSIQLGLGPAAFGSHGVVDQYRNRQVTQPPLAELGMGNGLAGFITEADFLATAGGLLGIVASLVRFALWGRNGRLGGQGPGTAHYPAENRGGH